MAVSTNCSEKRQEEENYSEPLIFICFMGQIHINQNTFSNDFERHEMVIPRAFRYNELVCVIASEGLIIMVPKSPGTIRGSVSVYWV